MQVTQKMLDTFSNADFSDLGNADWEDSHIRAGLAAVLAMPEMQTLERFARAAAAHAATDGTDEWNHMIDVWNAMPQEIVNELLEPR